MMWCHPVVSADLETLILHFAVVAFPPIHHSPPLKVVLWLQIQNSVRNFENRLSMKADEHPCRATTIYSIVLLSLFFAFAPHTPPPNHCPLLVCKASHEMPHFHKFQYVWDCIYSHPPLQVDQAIDLVIQLKKIHTLGLSALIIVCRMELIF